MICKPTRSCRSAEIGIWVLFSLPLHLSTSSTLSLSLTLFFFRDKTPSEVTKGCVEESERLFKTAPRCSILRCLPPTCVFTSSLRGAVAVQLAQLIFPSENHEALRVHSCQLVFVTALTPSPPHVASPSVYGPFSPFRQLDVFSVERCVSR